MVVAPVSVRARWIRSYTRQRFVHLFTDLQALNDGCHQHDTRTECQVDAVESRQLLLQALQLQSDLRKVQDRLQQSSYLERLQGHDTAPSKTALENDHAFDHFHDLRDIAAYESH